jgi:pilus assembly protein Flp/PilA
MHGIAIKSTRDAIGKSLRRFFRDASGATSLEYAIIASGVSIVIVGTVMTLGSDVKDFYTSVSTALK